MTILINGARFICWTSSMETQSNYSLGLPCELHIRPNAHSAPSQHLFSISLISEQHWPSNAKHTALSEARLSLSFRGGQGIYCVTVWPWQWAVPGLVPRWVLLSRVEERDANTEPEVPSNAGVGLCYSAAVINAGTATRAPYHTVQWMVAVKSCYIMRGGSGGGAASGNVGQGGWIKRGIKDKEAQRESESEQQWDLFTVRKNNF